MTNAEIQTFIETMEEIGDIWTEEQVKDIYGKTTLKNALRDRQSQIGEFANIINKVINS